MILYYIICTGTMYNVKKIYGIIYTIIQYVYGIRIYVTLLRFNQISSDVVFAKLTLFKLLWVDSPYHIGRLNVKFRWLNTNTWPAEKSHGLGLGDIPMLLEYIPNMVLLVKTCCFTSVDVD